MFLEHSKKIGIIIEPALIRDGVQRQIRMKEFLGQHHTAKQNMLLPYHPAEKRVDLPDGFDGLIYPDGMEKVPRKAAIIRANRYAVDHCDYLIAYAWHPASNARNLVEYAQRRKPRGLIKVTLLNTPKE